jgi:hypothetical protein
VKDVYFQRNPFPLLMKYVDQGKDFFAFEEKKENTIAWDVEGNWVLNSCYDCVHNLISHPFL